MLDFFASISDAIVTLFSFLSTQVQNLFYVLQMLVKGSVLLQSCIAFMPPVLGVFAMAAMTLTVVFMIIDR